MGSKSFVAILFLGASLFMQKSHASPPSWWDMTPEVIREKINKRIMDTEASVPAVSSLVDLTIHKKSRTTPLRIYTPSKEKDLPIILFIHGGAWVAGNLDTHDNLARYLCSETQAVVVSVGYLNAPEGKFPLPLEQCYDALLWVTEHASNYSADSKRIAVVGDSAGGNMTAGLCLMARDRSGPKIDLQVLINPAPDLTCNGTITRQNDALDILRWQAFQYLSDPKDATNPYVSPLVANDLSRLPTAVVIVAEKDDLRDAGQKYAERLQAASVPTTVYCQKDTNHLAGDGARASPRAKESLDVASAALKSAFSKNKTEFSKHSQEPVPPYPYDEEEVMFVNRADGVTLAGTLTLPRTQGPFPAVILLHGSAPLDRDCSLFGHKFFLVWADHLTRQGIAVLRFDKRSARKSTGNYETATIEDFAADALAGVEYLKSRKEINIKQIGLIGHSEGGMTAPLAASKSEDVAFVVMMASPCVNWEKMMNEQVALLHRADGVSEETIALNQQLLQQMFAVIKKQENRELAAKQLRELFSELTIAQRTAFEAYYGTIDQQINLFNSVWFRFSATYDPAATLRKVRIPVLALMGERDVNVSSKQNLPLISKALEEGGNKDYKVMELQKLNHGFQTCQTGSPKEHATIDETTAPAALNLMSDWILQKTAQVPLATRN